jgi:hypothetical protein
MDAFRLAYDQHALVFWLILFAAVAVVGLWVWRVQRYARQVGNRVDAIVGDTSEENTARMLVEYLSTVRNTAASVARMQRQHDEVVHLMPSVIRHVGLVRFSPFHDTGGDQSFTLALPDSRLYAKPVEGGSSSYSLTPEEREAMNRALNGRPVATHA